MFGSVVLDVVIGLVFIYLLYSLLASIISELIATFLGLRARNLKQGIARMLEDESKGYLIIKFFKRMLKNVREKDILRIFEKNDELLKKFYQQPTIKYLGASKLFSKPSYISSANFSKTILDLLKKQGGIGATDLEKIKTALSNTKNEDQLNAIKRLIEDPSGDDTQKVEGIKVLINRYGIDQQLFHGETREHIVSLLEDAQNDLVKFKGLLEGWFDDTMERVTGWYKRTNQIMLLFIGLGLAIIFNANTLEMVNILSNDKEARQQMVQMASAYVKENEELMKRYEKENIIDTSNTSASINEFNTQLDSLLKIKGKLEADIEEVNQLMGFRPPSELNFTSVDTLPKYTISSTQRLIQKKYLVEFPNAYLAKRTSKYYELNEVEDENKNTVYKMEFNRSGYIMDNLWGYLITALAISLGAPFWFDLLNKLMKLRSSVQQTTQSSSKKNDGSVPVDQRVG